MRTTLSLDDDVYLFARSYARQQHISIDEAISRLAREGMQAQNIVETKVAAVRPKGKYALLLERDEIITTEIVRDLMDRESI